MGREIQERGNIMVYLWLIQVGEAFILQAKNQLKKKKRLNSTEKPKGEERERK